MENALGGLQEAVVTYGPKIIMTLIIFVIALIVAKIVSWVVRFVIGKIGIGDAESRSDLQSGAGSAAFWVTMLIAIPVILEPLGMQGILEPLQNMVDKFLAFLPNLIGAAVIFGIGYIVASVAKKAVTGLLNAGNIDEWASRVGLGEGGLAKTLGTLVFVILIIPIAISALDTLQMDAISGPAKAMLQIMMDAIPNVIGAAIILGISYFIARFASNLLASVLPTFGVDEIGQKIGLADEMGGTSISNIAANVVFIAIMLFGLIEAAKILNFQILSLMMAEILALGARVLLGTAIIAGGFFLATKISAIVAQSESSAGAAGIIKAVIIVLAAAMGLRQMGLANEIVTMGFSLGMGAIAIAAAIAFGWGGRDAAGRLMNKWTRDL